jgi:aerobic carbon-monoxide dehydrogenase large subunit
MERVVFDEDGQLLTGSFMDYQLPRAGDLPDIGLPAIPSPPPRIFGRQGLR